MLKREILHHFRKFHATMLRYKKIFTFLIMHLLILLSIKYLHYFGEGRGAEKLFSCACDFVGAAVYSVYSAAHQT